MQDPNVKKFKNDPKSKLNFQDKSVNIYSDNFEIIFIKRFVKYVQNFQYLVDYKFHADRFYINNMPLQGINVTLFGRIDSISENVSILLFINFSQRVINSGFIV